MSSFLNRFFICNILISLFLLIFLITKRGLRQQLSARIQYSLWLFPLILLALPFFPLSFPGPSAFFTWLAHIFSQLKSKAGIMTPSLTTSTTASAADWMNDFAVSVTPKSTFNFGIPLAVFWLAGIVLVTIFMIRSKLKLYHLEKSALPLQNETVRRIFFQCCKELELRPEVSVFSTAFLKSPVTLGLLHPRIYLPIHLISDYTTRDMRYILLHELCHSKRKDALGNTLMNLVVIIYWFHPLIWYARKEMINDREIACDSAVLQLLCEKEHTRYGHTLLRFSEKVSHISSPFSSGISGSFKQMKRRILNIASYEQETPVQRIKGRCLFLVMLLLVMGISSFFPSYAGNDTSGSKATVSALMPYGSSLEAEDLSSFFQGYEGCFVLYNQKDDSWQIYNKTLAKTRMSPYSTYKIYSAMAALEYGIISPDSNSMAWNGETYPFAQWNQNQTLTSALQNSVNWYFQSLNADLGLDTLENFYKRIGYGNHDLSGGISDFWGDSSLQISPTEQVTLLKNFYQNTFEFKPQNVTAVKDAMLLSTSANGSLYGKTGTGAVNGESVHGWFIGYMETPENIWFFATNIQGASDAGGSAASEITLDILRSKGIF